MERLILGANARCCSDEIDDSTDAVIVERRSGRAKRVQLGSDVPRAVRDGVQELHNHQMEQAANYSMPAVIVLFGRYAGRFEISARCKLSRWDVTTRIICRFGREDHSSCSLSWTQP